MGNGVDAVDRALLILNSFEPGRERQSLAQLAKTTRLHKSTILRLARSLENGGFLDRDADGLFTIAAQPLRLAALFRRGLRLEDKIRPVLQDLVARTGESASFFRPQGQHRLCLFREESPRAIRDHVMEGDLLPLDAGAAGHVLRLYAEGRLDPATQPLFSAGERDLETAALAMPVHDHNGLAGALTISGPLARFDADRVATMSTLLREHGHALSVQLGGHAQTG